ncbi:hypothetical protein DRN63_04840 [Nanoarchaeota archaeon]|nr:MAG: hypothetical protein DRN63_04840 [Nanoarchaeota archaeon]
MSGKQATLTGEIIEETIPTGYIKCFVSGKLRKDTPEERVRQEVAKSLAYEYGYKVTDMEVEFRIQIGRKKPRADLVIFYENSIHSKENVYIIVETKKPDIKPSDKDQGVDQLISYLYACPNAKYGLWVGSERIVLEVVEKEGKKSVVQIPDIPPRGETTTPRPVRSKLVPAINLKQVFKRIHNYIYANQGLQKDKAFEELLKLIFAKVYDEQYSVSLQFYILPREDIAQVRKRIESLFEKVKERYSYIFDPNETISLNDRVLAYAMAELQKYSLVDTDVDIKGEAYEEIVGPNLRGDRGEFFTPRNVCKMTIQMIFSLFDEDRLTSVKILDPAVGTGGFLISAIHEYKKIFEKRGFKYDQLRGTVKGIAENNIYGIDFNPFLVKVAQMNMVMHGDGSANMMHANSLEHPANWSDDVLLKLFGRRIGEFGGLEPFRRHLNSLERPEEIDEALSIFDIVVTNPPFGTRAVIDDFNILKQYEITFYKAGTPRSSLPPERLFIERCLQFLKPGGFMAIVLPDSILSNPGLKWLREWILERAYVIASVDLPKETFEPHTGTQTSILILRKKRPEERKIKEDYEIFMAIPEKVGHNSRGEPVYKLTPDGEIELDENGNPIVEDHLPTVAELFRKWVEKKGLRWKAIS